MSQQGRLAGWCGLLLFLAVTGRALAEEPSAPGAAEVGEAAVFSTGPLEYRPGRGLRLDSIGVIGGFTNIKAETTEEAGGEFTLDTLNFFLIFDRFTRFRAVAELQLKDIFVADEDGAGTQDFAFDVRRLFGELTIADPLRVRAGTFLTPVGYWNLLLAPPLTWTTEAPLIVEEVFFEPTTTGLMLHGSTGLGSGQLGYSLFSQFLKPLEDDPDLNPPDYTAGARLTYEPAPAWAMGVAYQAADRLDDWSHLGTFHLLWQPSWGEILAEVYFQESLHPSADGDDEEAGADSSQWGTYLQGVYEIYRPFYLVGRYEYFDPRRPDPRLNVFTLGAVWRPFPFMALKVEYRFADRSPEEDDPQGFFSSFTTFF